MDIVAALPPLTRLILAYSPMPRRRADLLIWAFDARLADVIRSTREPMIGQMKIAWWDEALTDESGVKGRGEPLLQAMRDAGIADNVSLQKVLDGWEALIGDPLDDDALSRFSAGRGSGMFAALADSADPPPWLAAAGRLWALWDLSGHVSDVDAGPRAIALAQRELAALDGVVWPRAWKALRLLTGLARHDVMRGRAAAAGDLTPGMYARLLRLSVLGR